MSLQAHLSLAQDKQHAYRNETAAERWNHLAFGGRRGEKGKGGQLDNGETHLDESIFVVDWMEA